MTPATFCGVADEFTLVSWNIFQGLHYDSRKDAWVQNEGLVDHLRSLDADVLVLPEAWRFRVADARWAEEVAAELGYELHRWISDEPSREREFVPWSIAIMSRVPVRRLEPQVFPKFGKLGRRALLRVELVDSGLILAAGHLYGIHLALLRRPHHWLRERKAFRAASVENDIIAGDMNIWGPVIDRDAPEHRRAVLGRTYPAQRPHSQIDHILVNDRVEVVSSEVLPEMGSDHRAVRAVLRPRGAA